MIPLSDTVVRRLGYGVIAIAMAFAAAEIAVSLSRGEALDVAETLILAIAFGGVMTLSVRAVPRNGAVWAIISAAFFGIAGQLGDTITRARVGIEYSDIEKELVSVAPASIDTLSAIAIAVALSTWVSLFILTTHLLILFPGGKAVSRLWRRVAWLSAFALVAHSIPTALAYAPWVETPYDEIYRVARFFQITIPLLMVASAGSLYQLVRRYRRSSGDERLQYRWITWALAIQVLTIFGFGLIPETINGVVSSISLALIPIAFGIAITKYRLYDIDVVISRTFVYGSLAVFIGAVYVAIVVGIGTLVGSGDEPNAGLAIAATAIVAVAFQPLRRRLERLANRLVYGRKATPYEVLSEFSRRVAATDDTLLDDAARSLVDGTGADHAAVWVIVGDQLLKTAEWPESSIDSSSETSDFPIAQDGAELGVLTLATPRGQKLPEEDHRLAREVASGMGLALRNQALTESLQARVEELRDSRRRLVAVQDETRRKLERDLHDGSQQQLVALKVKLGLARAIASKDGASQTAALVEQLSAEADGAVDAMRDFARGVYPPLLEAEGLGSAISAHARRVPIAVTIETDGVGRYSREVEATVYFCVLEALQNTTKHANATRASVSLAQANGSVAFSVTDDGDGFATATAARGAGLTNMEDRLDAAGGRLVIDTTPGSGTAITGTIPVPAEAPA